MERPRFLAANYRHYFGGTARNTPKRSPAFAPYYRGSLSWNSNLCCGATWLPLKLSQLFITRQNIQPRNYEHEHGGTIMNVYVISLQDIIE